MTCGDGHLGVEGFEGKRIVVTGGAGFIGSHLVDRLLEQRARVQVLDDLSSGVLDNLAMENPDLVFQQVDVSAREGSVPGISRLDRAIALADFVFHLASPIGVARAHHDRLNTTGVILKAGINLVEACRRHRRPLLYASSSEVYGPGAKEPLRETDQTQLDLQPRWCYGAAKFVVEHLVAGLFRNEGIPTWIVRIFNVAGPRQCAKTGLVVPAFCKAALDGEPLVVQGDGSDKRAYLHVYDAVAGLLAIVGNDRLVGCAANLGGTETLSTKEVARRVVALLGQGEIVHIPHKELFGNDFAPAPDRRPDLTRIRNATKWRPRYSLDEAIRGCLETM